MAISFSATILYNIALEQRKGWWLRYHNLKTGINYKYQNAQLVDLKEGFPQSNCLYSLVAQEVLRLLQKNFRSFFRRLKNQEKNGGEITARSPRFRSTKYFFTLSYLQSGFTLKGGKLVLSGGMEEYTDKKGRTKSRQHKEVILISGFRKLPNNVHSVTITHDEGKFYAANLTYEVEPLKKWIAIVDYKLEYRGKAFVPVDERYTTQECNHCGHRVKLDPSVRVYQCPKCGMVLGRDENSAINMLNRVIAGIAQQKKNYKDFRVRIAFHRTLSGRWSHKDKLIKPA